MTQYRRKLIEVALPLAAINAESAREKSIRHGHPSTLHLWWARRPLAACRAVLFASLVDDPDSDPQYIKPDGTLDEEAAGMKRADLFNLIEELVMWENSNNPSVIRSARAEIARCVASRCIETGKLEKDTLIWSVDEDMTSSSKDEKQAVKQKTWTAWEMVTRCHCKPRHGMIDKKVGRVRFSFDVGHLPPPEVINKFLNDYAPPALDPFAGGGSIPLEAQRLGLRAHATDLNPVPVLINKALIEIPSRFSGMAPTNPDWSARSKEEKSARVWNGAEGLAEDVRFYGKWMREEAQRLIGNYYPQIEITDVLAKSRPDLKPLEGQKLTVIAWIWARTVASPDPSRKGAHVPLVKSFWLSTKKNRLAWVNAIVSARKDSYHFEVSAGSGRPAIEGTVNRKGGTCILSSTPIPFEHIRRAGKAGELGCRLIAIVAEGSRGRVYIPPQEEHENAALAIRAPDDLPSAEMAHNPFSLRPPLYGLSTFDEIFSKRQLAALSTFSDLLNEIKRRIQESVSGSKDYESYADAVITYLAFAIDKGANYWSSMCAWSTSTEKMVSTFGRQAIPMVWDFAEANPFSDSTGNFMLGVEQAAKSLDKFVPGIPGVCDQHDAAAPYRYNEQFLISTDPPYYNNIDYADLSDFFYIWLRRALRHSYPTLFSTLAVPKAAEIVASPYRFNGSRDEANTFFETSLQNAFQQMRRAQNADYPLSVFYAFKQSEESEEGVTEDGGDSETVVASTGWETMLEGLVKSGFSIQGTWPMRTELTGNLKKHMNALASSVVLVARPRSSDAVTATRKQFIATLRKELPESLRNLQRGNIAPVDLAQAAIGPGMAIFTSFSGVVESDGSAMTVRTALGLINQTLDEVLAEQEGDFDSDTRWALAWYEQFGQDEGTFGDAELLSKAKNTSIRGLQDAGIIVAKAGKARLVRRDELSDDWNPANDKRLTVWEVTQHLIRRLDQQGEIGAAELISKLGGIAEVARDLAYRLYSTCERKKWSQEALAYNSLVVAWPELSKIARSTGSKEKVVQGDLF